MLKAILNFFKPYKKEEPVVEISTADAGNVITVAPTDPVSTVTVKDEVVVEKVAPKKPATKATQTKKAPVTKKPAKITAGVSKPRKKK